MRMRMVVAEANQRRAVMVDAQFGFSGFCFLQVKKKAHKPTSSATANLISAPF